MILCRAKQATIDPDVLFTQRPTLKNGDSLAWLKLLKSDRVSAAIKFNLTGDIDRAEELSQMIEQGQEFRAHFFKVVIKSFLNF